MSGAPIVTRFAPSPTGLLHLGNARTALLNALAARHAGGRFLLRIEDTDRTRGDRGLEARVLADLEWLGLSWDEGPDRGGSHGPYRQSEREAVYRGALGKLEHAGLIYPCFCTQAELAVARRAQLAAGEPPRYPGTCRDLSEADRAARRARGLESVTRFRVPAGQIVEFEDRVHGVQRFATDAIGDFVIRRADGSAAFFFANAVDDAEMGVTLVMRGDDHLSNTPRQLLILEALGLPLPAYAHISLLLASDGSPLSKRAGAPGLPDYRARGFLPEALRNHLARLGHTPGKEGWLTDDELVAEFALERLGRAPARFDEAQLLHWQKLAVAHADRERLADWLREALATRIDPERRNEFIAVVRGNIVLPADAVAWAHRLGELDVPYDDESLAAIRAAGPAFFLAASQALAVHGTELKPLARAISSATGRRGPDLYKPLRAALTGTPSGPELGPVVGYLGAERAAARFEQARVLAG
jgi:glutamyl-tRNA synthetase